MGDADHFAGGVGDDLRAKIRDCYQQAEECAQRAKVQADLTVRQEWLVAERRWLMLARSYEYGSRRPLSRVMSDANASAYKRQPSGFGGSDAVQSDRAKMGRAH